MNIAADGIRFPVFVAVRCTFRSLVSELAFLLPEIFTKIDIC
jgi:hypothetical protein